MAERAYRERELAAFLGFQVYNLSPYKGNRPMNWDKYKSIYGVRPLSKGHKQATLGKKAEEIAKAKASFKKAFGDLIPDGKE